MAVVSVLVPVYNVEKYLGECLESIIEQTLSDIEIICVNDGSTDKSPEILKKYAKKDTRIKIINKENGGLPSARNAGIAVATGEYVSFVDSDDYIEPDMMERLYAAAKENQSEIVICGANIFPKDPVPEEWLFRVLSPEKAYYKTGDEKLLFENPASRPFIWRTFIKRSLLERTNFRLNEGIHVGEDNAFQFRIYPKADGITLIPDKLYNYRWYREDSLMNSLVYKDVEKKFAAHMKMVEHVASEWEISEDMKKMGQEYLKWSIEFLYDDFIKLPIEAKIRYGKALVDMCERYDFYRYQYSYPEYIREMFQYIYAVAGEETAECKLSVVISTDWDYAYLEDALKSCLTQSLKEIELIIINNGAGDKSYSIIHKYLHKDKRVRVYNTKKSHFTDGYNIGLSMCKGKFVLFIHPDDWLSHNDALKEWVEVAEKEHADVTLSLYQKCDSIRYHKDDSNLEHTIPINDYYLEAGLGNALFLISFLKKQKLSFKNYSIESGKVFLTTACLTARTCSIADQVLYVNRNLYQKDWIPTEECVLVLKSFVERLKLANKHHGKALYNKIYSLIISDYYMNILVNNTRPYFMSVVDCPDGENSQSDVLKELMAILSLLDPDMLYEQEGELPMLPILFSRFVEVRHQYISNISDEYMNI